MSSIRILYACGAADAVKDYETWSVGKRTYHGLSNTCSIQLMRICEERGLFCHLVSRVKRPARVAGTHISAENKPIPFQGRGGILYHVGQLYYELYLIWTAVRLRTDLVIVRESGHWFVMCLMSLFGTKVIPELQCSLWNAALPDMPARRTWLRRANDYFFSRHAFAVLVLSKTIGDQVRRISGPNGPPIINFVPNYHSAPFDAVPEPNSGRHSFRVLYIGRIERNKGVFDLLETAERLRTKHGARFLFDLCGKGRAYDELSDSIRRRNLNQTVTLHGHCDRSMLLTRLGECNVVLVPTTRKFNEGGPRTAAEAILCRRPAIVSKACPIAGYIKNSITVVEPEDIDGYANAIERLADDEHLYAQKVASCEVDRRQFVDANRSFRAMLERIIDAVDKRKRPEPINWLGISA